MRIDSHQHFWTYDPERYPWIGAGMEVLARDYGPADLVPHLERHGLDGSIAVQARQDEAETRALLDRARLEPRVRGVVGWVDLRAPDVEARLDRLHGTPGLVGFRHIVQDEPDDRFLLREDFGRGVDAVGARGWTYDVLVYQRHLPVVHEFLERHPDQPLVLDHVGKPALREGDVTAWARDLRAVAEHPRLSCKLSGLVTEARWDAWEEDAVRACLDVAYEAFGPDRVLFGSDWPVCLLAASYERVFGLVERWSEGLDDAAREKLFGGNAERVYGLAEARP